MNIAKIFLILLSSSIFSCIANSKCIDQTCSQASIDDRNTVIRFPFRVATRNQPKDCGYPGFDVQCNAQSAKPVLELPNSVFFDVDSINYRYQQITLSDPFDCVPLKLLNLNLSTSPFYSKYYQEFAVFNCSGIYPTYQYNHTTNYDLHKVDCLSGVNHTVYAVETYGAVSLLSPSCQRAANIVVPTDYGSLFFYGATRITLNWDEPRCGPCDNIYRRCRVKSDPAHEIECTSEIYPSIDSPSIPNLTLGLAIGIPLLVVSVAGLMFWTRRRRQRDESDAAQSMTTRLHTEDHTTMTTGLDQSIIESYPRAVIGDSGRLIIPEDYTCPICLSEYQIGQVLEILPHCQHRFHESCIDQWLVQNATCPVCRVPPPRC